MKKAVKKLLSSSLHSTKSTRWFVGSLLLMLTVASCTREHSNSSDKVSDGELYVTLNIPCAPSAQTRAIGPTEEDTIESIYVLAFEVKANGDEVFEYHSIAKVATGHVPGVPNQAFTTKVRLKSYEQRFVVIANAKTQVEALLSNNWSGGLKDDMLKTLTVSLENVGDKWNTINVGNYTKFPMWGESNKKVIQENTTSLGLISMIRMIAKIDVLLNPATQNANLFNEFKLASVHLYNTSQTGRVAPSTAAGDWDVTNPSNPFARNPSMPTGWTDADRIEGPLAYTDFNLPGIPDQSMVGTIYTFEIPTNVTASKRPCLVVGGYYYDPVTSAFDANQSYYRLDLIRKLDGSFMPILRNHKYVFNIVNIKGRGYPTVDEAFHALPINMEVEVVTWNEGAVGDVVSDGQYHLAIRPNAEFEFARSTETQTAQVKTDYPAGWEVTKITEVDGATTNSGWLTTDKVIGALQPAGSFVAIDITVDENTSGADRIGYVYVKAGRMNMRIMVTQTLNSNLSLVLRNHVTLTEFQEYTWITEPSVTPLDVDIDLLWGPRQSDVFVSNDKGEMTSSEVFLFDQALGYDVIAPGQSTILGGLVNPGTKRFVIRPKSVSAQNLVDDPLYDKSSKIEFIVNDGVSGVLKKTINLRHWVGPKVIATSDKSMYELAPGSTGTITVRSNTDFTVEISTEAGNNPMTSGGTPCVIFDNGVEGTVHTPNTAGTALGFTLGDDTTDPEINLTTIKIIIKSPAGLFSDVTVNFDASLLIWVGPAGYAPAKSDSGNAAFFAAAALCPTGYILPTTAIVNAWKTSHYTLPDAGIYWTSEYGFRNNASYDVGLNSNVRTIYEYGKAFDGIGTYSFLHTRHSSLNLTNNTGFVAQTAVLWGAWTSEYQHYRVRDNYGGLYGWESRIYDWDVPGNHYAARWTLTANGVTANVRCVKKVI